LNIEYLRYSVFFKLLNSTPLAHFCPPSFGRISHFIPAGSWISSFVAIEHNYLINIDNNLPAIASSGGAGGIVDTVLLSA